MIKLSVKIKTTKIGGRFQHKIHELNWKRGKEVREISDGVVNMLKKVNEELYKEMPEDSKDLVSYIGYTIPHD